MPGHPDFELSKLRVLTPRERARLIAILTRLTSPYSGERAAAGLLASAFVAKHGLNWADLTTLLRPLPDTSVTSHDPPPKHERRLRGSRSWQGYCRRRLVRLGQALDRLT